MKPVTREELIGLGAQILNGPIYGADLNEEGEILLAGPLPMTPAKKIFQTCTMQCDDAAARVQLEIANGLVPFIFMNGDSPYWNDLTGFPTIRFFSARVAQPVAEIQA